MAKAGRALDRVEIGFIFLQETHGLLISSDITTPIMRLKEQKERSEPGKLYRLFLASGFVAGYLGESFILFVC